jgi:hypothetical protein
MDHTRSLDFTSFYEADGDVYIPTPATSSPWDARAQHGGPPTALLAYALQTNHPRGDAIVTRASIDFLGTIPRVPLRVRTRIIRPGARIELGEAVLAGRTDDREYLVGRFWRIRTADVALPVVPLVDTLPPLPPPQPQTYFPGIDENWGYGNAIEWRFCSGTLAACGPADAWTRVRVPLVAGAPLDQWDEHRTSADRLSLDPARRHGDARPVSGGRLGVSERTHASDDARRWSRGRLAG